MHEVPVPRLARCAKPPQPFESLAWRSLVQVNASPSLTTTTKADRLLKFKIINDALSIVTPPSWSGSGAGSSGKGSSRNRESAAADR